MRLVRARSYGSGTRSKGTVEIASVVGDGIDHAEEHRGLRDIRTLAEGA